MVAIFYFSNTPGVRITDPGTWIGLPRLKENVTLLSILHPNSDFYFLWSIEMDSEFVLRKLAHISFFGLLAFLIYLNLPEGRGRYLLAGGFTALFAFTDEVHQAFITGRDGRLMDVMLDVASGALVLLFIYILKRKGIMKNQLF
ncbi:VanZ family protein [Domibacillus robiginosus]|uniref:VanZ family protein n=1 Tax=Domibacillus robiginosus TaxID=1071054 RepID=UPI001FDF7F0E